MAFTSSTDIPRVVTSQTSPLTAPKVLYPNGGQLPGVRCCDTGRPVALDPVTGSTVCSCQIKTGIPAYLSRVPSLPETVYGTGNGNFIPPNVVMGQDAASAFYHMGLKSSDRQPEGGLKSAQPSAPSPYYLEHLMAAHTYNAFYSGLDINSARRKNATRETTSALKAWLYEHRKNPYPTKGEKIMLAIITRMTLTQVSTWFANARRRLKKENKLEGREDDLSDIDIDDTPSVKSPTSCDMSSSSTTYRDSDDDRRRSLDDGDLSDISDVDDPACRTTPSIDPKYQVKQNTDIVNGGSKCRIFSLNKAEDTTFWSPTNDISRKTNVDTSCTRPRTLVPRHMSHYVSPVSSKDKSDSTDKVHENCDHPRDVPTKPKIWSISEIINSSKETSSKPHETDNCSKP